jgi:hypothetical protein
MFSHGLDPEPPYAPPEPGRSTREKATLNSTQDGYSHLGRSIETALPRVRDPGLVSLKRPVMDFPRKGPRFHVLMWEFEVFRSDPGCFAIGSRAAPL